MRRLAVLISGTIRSRGDLAYAYAKTKNYAEARQILNKLVAAPGPFQQPARELLAKVGAR